MRVAPAQPSPTRPPWDRRGAVAHSVTKVVKSLADMLFAGIVDETYPFGTRLPAERQLAEAFAVSRNSIRQALDLMETHGVIARRAGSGSFVTYRASTEMVEEDGAVERPLTDLGINLQEIAEITGPLELNVARSIVEPEIVRLAVINMSARDIGKLRQILDELEAVTTSADDFARGDRDFHMQLARGTRNPLLIGIYALITHVRRHAHWARTTEKTLSPARIRDYQKKLRSIFEAVESRDIENAVEFVKLHMTDVQRDLLRDI